MEIQSINNWPYNTILRLASEWWSIITNTNWYNLTNILRTKNETELFLVIPTNDEWININIFSGKNQNTKEWKSIWSNLTLEELITNINSLWNHKILIKKTKAEFFYIYEIFVPNDYKEETTSRIKYMLWNDILYDIAKIKEIIEEWEYYKLSLMLIWQSNEKIRNWFGCLFKVLGENNMWEYHFESFIENILLDPRWNNDILILLINHVIKFKPFWIDKLIDPNTQQEICYLKLNWVNILVKWDFRYIRQVFSSTDPESTAIYLERNKKIEIYEISHTLH